MSSILDKISIIFIFLIFLLDFSRSQHEDIPYEPIENICKKCVCLTAQDGRHPHHILSCSEKRLRHILPRWPEEFGTNHTGIEIISTFSENAIPLLQQLPQTNASLSFTCRHCGIKDIQSPAFVDVPNILRLDLSWNYLNEDVLTPDIFRGPYNSHAYEPIALEYLDISRNYFRTLDRRIFEHTPHLKTLILAHNEFNVIDAPTTFALSTVPKLEHLDISYNDLLSLPNDLFKNMKNLKELDLEGNLLKMLPVALKNIGHSLQFLNFGRNPTKEINENISDLIALTELNISGMLELEVIEYGAFARLDKLKALICSNNPKLEVIDITSLRNATNLEILDISNNSLKTLFVTTEPLEQSLLPTWTKLHYLHIERNPWHCGCYLLRLLENYKTATLEKGAKARCDTPYDLAGSIIPNLDVESICQLPIAHKIRNPTYDPSEFFKPRSIILSIITITIVVAIGIIVGFGIAIVKRRLKKTEPIFTTPIRYTIVRNE